ncbi:hypothetical protein WS75_10315 [Burkholderia sp. FL-7-2-10-S1-D7]|nr:hypothetical protein WS75_10315 [Burkholderia sp. FL-7-2-10-S1-D7]
MDRGRVAPVRPTFGRPNACGTRSAKRGNRGTDRGARCSAPPAVQHSLCRTWGWHSSRACDDITGPLFVRARINNLFDEDDELA